MGRHLPAEYESGLLYYEDEVIITDRNGNDQGTVGDSLIDVNPDWNIDRAGSKGNVAITVDGDVLSPNMWIEPYRTIYPEDGEPQRYQLGHFMLGNPGSQYSDGFLVDLGTPATHQTARGTDIIDSIAAVALRETFYTPVGGNIMQDIRVLIKMSTVGRMGRNLLTNHSFENESAGWRVPTFEDGAAGSAQWTPSGYATADGEKSFSPQINTGPPINSYVYTDQLVPIPDRASFMYLSGLSLRTIPQHAVSLRMGFRDEDNTNYGDTYSASNQMTVQVGQWFRHFIVAPVPQGATHVRVYCYVQMNVDAYPFGSRSSWDDIRLGTCDRMPLPDSRINLPPSDASATTRIQTTETKSIGYDAINADRCGAISHHAIFTDLSGHITTMPSRSAAETTPRRVYGPGDWRIVGGDVEIKPLSERMPNHFPAIKEAIGDDGETWYAEAWNDNPNDLNSIVHTDVYSAERIYAQDAVSQEALQAMADAARDHNSAQEELTFTIHPDHELTVYDVIEIADPNKPRAVGKWLIKNIGFQGPLMVITARRALGGWT